MDRPEPSDGLRLARPLAYYKPPGERPVDQDAFGSPFPGWLNVLMATFVVFVALLGAAAGFLVFLSRLF